MYLFRTKNIWNTFFAAARPAKKMYCILRRRVLNRYKLIIKYRWHGYFIIIRKYALCQNPKSSIRWFYWKRGCRKYNIFGTNSVFNIKNGTVNTWYKCFCPILCATTPFEPGDVSQNAFIIDLFALRTVRFFIFQVRFKFL